MLTIAAVLGCALLFGLAAVAVPQRTSCGGNCGSCGSSCARDDEAATPRS